LPAHVAPAQRALAAPAAGAAGSSPRPASPYAHRARAATDFSAGVGDAALAVAVRGRNPVGAAGVEEIDQKLIL
jgi:hypothetical protein